MNAAVPPREALQPALWMAGYELRCAHRPLRGQRTCPFCPGQLWPCAKYLTGHDLMTRAMLPHRPPFVTGLRTTATRYVGRAQVPRLDWFPGAAPGHPDSTEHLAGILRAEFPP